MGVMEKEKQKIEFDEEKFKELVVYIARMCQDDIYFGATKLNKILFFSDFISYRMQGKPITGAEYFALDWGPVPTAYKRIRDEMVGKDIIVQKFFRQQRTLALREANLEKFSPEEISIVHSVIDALRDKDSEAVSLLSHGMLGWKAAWTEYGTTDEMVAIPYDTVFVSNPSLDEFEEAHGLELLKVIIP